MPIEKINIETFISLARQYPVLDVRSPAEYFHAHIPGAHSIPLFTDEERKRVGTAYKQQSREAAIKIGLEYFGPRMRTMVEEVEALMEKSAGTGPMGHNLMAEGAESNHSKRILIHCWRGGMRSAAIAWLMDLYGFKVYSLAGGYKKFRQWVLEKLASPHCFRILGGYTGSGKTYVLKALEKSGECVIDLESLANHKGSAFGNIGMPAQPSQEMFENMLAMELHQKSLLATTGMQEQEKWEKNKLQQAVTLENSKYSVKFQTGNAALYAIGHTKPIIWLEDESQRIGLINLPQPFWQSMRRSPVIFLDIPYESRLEHIVKEYGQLNRQRMAEAIERIRKRLGPLETKTALAHLEAGETEACFRILLKYYDKFYQRGLWNRDNAEALIKVIPCSRVNAAENAQSILLNNRNDDE